MRFIFVILCIVSGGRAVVASTPQPITFDTCDLGTRIAFSYTRDMVYDHMGYLWVATQRGLYQIDGSAAHLHVYNPSDSLSLANNIVQRLYLDQDSTLWVLTDKSIQYYDYQHRTFHHILETYIDDYFDQLYKISFTAAAAVAPGLLLLGTKDGALLYDKIDRQYVPVYPEGWSGEQPLRVIDIATVDSGTTYLLATTGLYQYALDSGQLIAVHTDATVGFQDLRPPCQALSWHDGSLYFIIGAELQVYDIARSAMHEYLLPSGGALLARDIEWLDDRYLLISTAEHGMYIYDADLQVIQQTMEQGAYNQLAIDHRGRLVTIANTEHLIKSREPVAPASRWGRSTVVLSDLHINGKPAYTTEKATAGPWVLRDYERSLSIVVAKTSAIDAASVLYDYQLDGGPWQRVGPSRRLSLDDLSAGRHTIVCSATESDHKLYGEPLVILIPKYFYEQWWFRALLLLTAGLLSYTIYSLLMARRRDAAMFHNKVIEMELHVLRSQMNPHFIFNTLNSIKNYVLTKAPEDAADYLTRFARLMRLILENSKSSVLTLDKELAVLRLYIEMEQQRLSHGFAFRITVDPSIDQQQFRIAPLLLQPFVENAIWHGLMPKPKDRLLTIDFTRHEHHVTCVIADNGIGRVAAAATPKHRTTTYRSFGLDITSDRIAHINRLYGIEASVQVEDAVPTGTLVTVIFPPIPY